MLGAISVQVISPSSPHLPSILPPLPPSFLIFLLLHFVSCLSNTSLLAHSFVVLSPAWFNCILSSRSHMMGIEGFKCFPGGSMVRILLPMQMMGIQSLGQEDPLEKEMATHSSVPAWKIPWTEWPGGLQSMWSQSWETTHQLDSSKGV